MCRILTYLGKPILIEELLYKPDNSFIKQSYHPKYMSYLLNLAGFGLAAWDTSSHKPTLPFLYKTYQLPFYDENLHSLATKISPHCLLSHLRGVAYHATEVVSNQNVHPFIFPGMNIALAHNGYLYQFDQMKYDLLEYIHPDYSRHIRGNTDSEWIYAIFLSQLSNPLKINNISELIKAITETIKILQKVRSKHNITVNSPINLFITNGEFIAATRFVLDYGWQPLGETSHHFSYHSLWYTYGESYGCYDNEYKMKASEIKLSIIISSEPLTEDTTTWVEVPEYSLLIANLENNEIKITSHDINL